MRLRLLGLILLSYVAVVTATQAAPPTPLIKVDASTLAAGPLATIANTGSVGGTFTAGGLQTPIVETVAGKKAITFNGSNGYKAGFTAPAGATGTGDWSVATWIYNPTISTNEWYFQWARRKTGTDTDGQCSILAYKSNDAWAAASHQGRFDLNWGRLYYPPAAGQWHHIVLTYDGAPPTAAVVPGTGTGTECVYVDGVLVNMVKDKPLNLVPDCQVLLGCEQNSFNYVNDPTLTGKWDKNGFSGSIASLQMFDTALSSDDVVTLLATGPALNVADQPILCDASFENYSWSGNQRTVGGDYGGLWGASVTGQPLGFNGWNCFTFGGVPPGGPSGKNNNFHVAHRSTSVWNNGLNVDGGAVAGIETVEPLKANLIQPLWNAKPNTTYAVWGWFNARGFNIRKGILQIVVDGTNVFPTPMDVTPVDADNAYVTPFRRIEGTFTTNGSANHWLAIQNTADVTNSGELLVDKIQVAEIGSPAIPVLSTTELPKLTSLDFYGQQQGNQVAKTFKLVNDGGSAMTVSSLSVIGADAAQYQVGTAPGTVNAYGGDLPIQVTFRPLTVGVFNNAQLKIDTNVGSILLPLTGFSVPQVANGSFESIYISTGGGDYQPSYPGWNTNATAGNIGFSYNNNWKWDNGNFADGRQAAALNKNATDGTITSMSQTIPGFIAGRNYRFRFYLNSWKGNTSDATDGKVLANVLLNQAPLTNVTKTPASGTATTGLNFPLAVTNLEVNGTRTKVYDRYTYDWTPAVSGPVTLQFDAVGDAATGDAKNSLLIDHVGVFDLANPGIPAINATRLDFGNRQINTSPTLSLTLTNQGAVDYTVSAAAFAGPAAAEFSMASPMPITVPAFGSTNFNVRFFPTTFGQKDSTMTLTTSVAGVSFTVGLAGFVPAQPLLRTGSLNDPVLASPSSDNQNNSATGWAWSTPNTTHVGRSATGAMYNNNGADPDGNYANWLRKGAADTTRTLYQDVLGFRAGRTYRVSLYANPSATNGTVLAVSGKAAMIVKLGSTLLTSVSLTAVDPAGTFATPWQKFTADYTATAADALAAVRLGINIVPSSTDDALLVDGVSIQEVAPLLQASPTSVRFNTVNWFKNDKPSTATITLTNNGLQALTFTGGATGTPGLAIVDAVYPWNPQFSIVSTTPANKASLAIGESMTVLVRFNATYKGVYSAVGALRVTSNDPNYSPLDIPLTGDGVPVELSTFSVE